MKYHELEDIHYKYERLQSLIGILQIFFAEVAEVANTPSDSIPNALFEIEIEMKKNNDRLKSFFVGKDGAISGGNVQP